LARFGKTGAAFHLGRIRGGRAVHASCELPWRHAIELIHLAVMGSEPLTVRGARLAGQRAVASGRAEEAAGRRQGFLQSVGPELISGASDNDPTNVGTAVAVGATTSYQLAWLAVLVAPLLATVQTIAAHVGAIAHSDLQTLTLRRFGPRVAMVLLVSVVVVNVVTIAADIQAGAAGIGVLAGIRSGWLVVPLGLTILGLLVIGKYNEVARVLRYLLLGYLAFGAAAVLAHPDWPQVLRASVVPGFALRRSTIAGGLSLLGTTLTSYVYVWETIGRGVADSEAGARGLARAKLGAAIGSLFTALVLWFMLIASAATLGKHHETVSSAQNAALALRPLGGSLAADCFAAGLLISAMVALPVLMATTAYVVGAQFHWRHGLSDRGTQARGFYGILTASIAIAFVVSLANVSIIDMLVAASVIGGLGTPLGIVILVLVARDERIMGTQMISRRLAAAGWIVAAVVGGFGLVFVVAVVLGKL
jgi:flagellin-like protein